MSIFCHIYGAETLSVLTLSMRTESGIANYFNSYLLLIQKPLAWSYSWDCYAKDYSSG